MLVGRKLTEKSIFISNWTYVFERVLTILIWSRFSYILKIRMKKKHITPTYLLVNNIVRNICYNQKNKTYTPFPFDRRKSQ